MSYLMVFFGRRKYVGFMVLRDKESAWFGLNGRRKWENFIVFRGCMNSIRKQYLKKEKKKGEKRKGENNIRNPTCQNAQNTIHPLITLSTKIYNEEFFLASINCPFANMISNRTAFCMLHFFLGTNISNNPFS